jgi:hypothetical protein
MQHPATRDATVNAMGAKLVKISDTYMRSLADLTQYAPTRIGVIADEVKTCELDASQPEDDRALRILGDLTGLMCPVVRQTA